MTSVDQKRNPKHLLLFILYGSFLLSTADLLLAALQKSTILSSVQIFIRLFLIDFVIFALLILFLAFFIWIFLRGKFYSVLAQALFASILALSSFSMFLMFTLKYVETTPSGSIVLNILCFFSGTLIFLCGWKFFGMLEARKRTGILWKFFCGILVAGIVFTIFNTYDFYRKTMNRNSGIATKSHSVPHVILITVDTLRWDAVSFSGSRRASTPNLDQLAKDSVIFRNAYSSAPWTLPSVVSLLSGQSPLVHGVLKGSAKLPDKLPMLSEIMKKSGYETSAIVSNTYFRHGLSQGFSNFQGFPKKPVYSLGTQIAERIWPDLFSPQSATASLISKLGRKWILENQRKDFFLWLHYFDPHMPYDPPSQFWIRKTDTTSEFKKFSYNYGEMIRAGRFFPDAKERQEIEDLYYGEVQYTDAEIGGIISVLKQTGIYENSLIIFTSDHGEELWDHGSFEHGHTVYDELLHVPLIIKLPKLSSKAIVEKTVSMESITPSILEICKLPASRQFSVEKSLAPFFDGSGESQTVLAFGALYFGPKIAFIQNDQKYIHNLESGSEEFYNLDKDPLEKHSLKDSSVDEIEIARRNLALYKKELEDQRKKLGIANREEELDPETIKQLKAVGYLQ